MSVEAYSSVTKTSPRFIGQILESAEVAYARIGQVNNVDADKVHEMPWCFDVIDEFAANLLDERKLGYRAAPVDVTFNFTPHRYISLYPPSSYRRIVADLAWQQFASREQLCQLVNDGIEPQKLIIGTPAEAARQALRYGFSSEQAAIWGPVE